MELPVTVPARPQPRSHPVTSPSPRLAPSLAAQLRHTARCVLAVEQGRSLSDVIPLVSADLRPGVQALTFHVLRHLGTARALVGELVQRKPEPAVMALLSSAVVLLLGGPSPAASEAPAGHRAASPEGPHYEPHTVVNQAVDAARLDRSTQRQAAFVNACLRRFLRERETLLQSVAQHPLARWNHPVWWIERLQRDDLPGLRWPPGWVHPAAAPPRC